MAATAVAVRPSNSILLKRVSKGGDPAAYFAQGEADIRAEINPAVPSPGRRYRTAPAGESSPTGQHADTDQ
jgi:hypothetical protein